MNWKNNIPALKELLTKAQRVLIISHINPDGDAVGASLGWWNYLQRAYPEKEIAVMFPNKFPEFLGWVEGANQAMIYADNKPAALEYIRSCSLIFCLDFNALLRLESLGEALKEIDVQRVLIDHHLQPADEFDLIFSDTSMSSTAEFVYRLVVELGGKSMISKGGAEALYVGLMTDTGSFSFSVNTPETFRMAADLMEFGIDKNEIAAKVYDSYSENRMRLLGYCLKNKMRVFQDHKAAYISLSRRELENFDFQPGDTEGFVNFPLSIKGIEVSALFTEALDRSHIRVSLRSKGNSISVNDLAREYFNGGGHFNASGGKFFKSLRECELHFEKMLKEKF